MSHPTFDEIVQALQARCEDVARSYAPGGNVSGGRYWALNPGRHDTSIGSFYVSFRGQYVGRWRDESTGDHGDMLDLIQLATNLDRKGAIEEAKQFLGMVSETAEMRERRRKREEQLAARREEEAAKDAEKRVQRQKQATATYLAATGDILGTPVEAYLAGRSIELASFSRLPKVIKYHPDLRYYHVDKKTGEVFEGNYPAMVAAIHGPHEEGGRPPIIGIHKTYLAQREDGTWGKAPVPKPKLIWGSKHGGYIRLWAGVGPRGGKGAPLARAPKGSRLFITEGIEDGLSLVQLKEARRVAVAIDLGNIGAMVLPPAITDITIIADNDEDPELRDKVQLSAERFASQGRRTSIWRSKWAKDLNDTLQLMDLQDRQPLAKDEGDDEDNTGR